MNNFKNNVARSLYIGKDDNNSHMLMVCDTFDYLDYPVYVKKNEDIKGYIKKYQNYENMSKIMEIYNYEMDLDYQLKESRAWHIKTEIKTIEIESLRLTKAREFAILKHQGQKRKNGDDYITHPKAVAELVLKFKDSNNIDVLMAAAYLHDVLEDTDTTYYELVKEFGYEVASLVMEVTTNKDMKDAIGKERYLAYKLKHMTSWALVIKLCDRLHNISDLYRLDAAFQDKYMLETAFIIDYICDNRELSETHKKIILAIRDTLKNLIKRQEMTLKKKI